MFWVTVALVLVTMLATAYNHLLFRSTVDPLVIVYATIDDKHPTLILLVIENIGRGVAKRVRFTTEKTLPEHAWGLDDKEAKSPGLMAAGPIVTGIPALGPGARRRLIWGQYGGLHQAIGGGTIRITAAYEADPVGPLPGREFVTDSLLEIASFEGTIGSPPDHLQSIAKELERIRRAIEKRGGES